MDINGVIRVNMTGAEIEEALLKARDLPTNTELTQILNEMQTAISERLDRIIEKTYDEMVALRDAAELEPGQLYRITDYVTTTMVEHTQSANHPFDIVVLALSPDTLSEAAMAMVHEGDEYFAGINLSAWQLKYTLDNIEHSATDGKGTITFMHDERNCEACFDFKNIQFKRWKVTDSRDIFTGEYVGILSPVMPLPDSLTIPDEADFVWSWLFGVDDPLQIYVANVETRLKVSNNAVFGRLSRDCKIYGDMTGCTWGSVIESTIGGTVGFCVGRTIRRSLIQSSVVSCVFRGDIDELNLFGSWNNVELEPDGPTDPMCIMRVLSNGRVTGTRFVRLQDCFITELISGCTFTKELYECTIRRMSNSIVTSPGLSINNVIFDHITEDVAIQRNNVTVSTDSNGVLKIWNPADLAQ